jgi:hypothetical protein
LCDRPERVGHLKVWRFGIRRGRAKLLKQCAHITQQSAAIRRGELGEPCATDMQSTHGFIQNPTFRGYNLIANAAKLKNCTGCK